VIHNELMETELLDILWESLRGGDYDLNEMKRSIRSDSNFGDLGIDSLDITDFFLRIESRYQVRILQEEYPNLDSMARLRAFLQSKLHSEPAA